MKTLLLLLLITSSYTLLGQQHITLAGTVLDKESSPVLIGDAVLYQNDSIVYHGGILDGIFKIEDIKAGLYELQLRCLGYELLTEQMDITDDISKDYVLTEDSKLLEEVTVTALRESVRYENGNVQVNMVNSIFAQQPSTIDALAMMPGIVTDPVTRAISLIGGGSPLLYIGNRLITVDELTAIPVTNIKSIEIIYHPSAKYEANGRSVLLITLLQNLDDGIRVELTENAVVRRRFNNYLGYNLSLRKGKWELRHNLNYNQLLLWEGGNSEITVPAKSITATNDFLSLGTRPQVVAGAGVHYQINDRDYLSINANLRTQNTTADLTSTSVTQLQSDTDVVDVLSLDAADRDFYTSNLNYNKYLPALRTNVFGGLQWSQYHRGLRNNISADRAVTGREAVQERDQDFDIQVLAGRLDLERPLSSTSRLELGTNIYRGESEAYQLFDDLLSASQLQRDYDYLESNYAFYGQVVGEVPGVNYTAGVRTETTNFYGKFEDEDEPLIDRQQTNVFPRVNLSYQIDSLSSLNLNFSSSIARPDYLNASSISTYITPYIEYERNVNLVPSPARYLSVNYQYAQQSLNVTAYSRDNLVQQSAYYDDDTQRIITGPENFDLEQGLNIRLNNQYSYKRWNINTVAMYSINQLKDSRGAPVDVKPYLYFYANSRWALPKQISLSINAYGITERNSGLYRRNERFVVGASLTKRWGDFTLSVNATDILRNMNFEEEYTVNDITNRTTYLGDVKSYSLSLRYSFGRRFRSNYQNDDVDENLNRMR